MQRGDIVDTVQGYNIDGKALATKRQYQNLGKTYASASNYDFAGRLTSRTYPNGVVVSYEYHPGTMLVSSVKGHDGRAYASFTEYGVAGQPVQINYGNGTSTRYSYDPTSLRLSGYITSSATNSAATDLQRRSYSYSPAGQILGITDQLANKTYAYGYDDLHRLTSETGAAQSFYQYDCMGNILRKTEGGTTLTYNYEIAGRPSLLSSVQLNGRSYNYAYDELGNLITGPDFSNQGNIGTRTIDYGADGMPLRISSPSAGAAHISYGNEDCLHHQ